MNSIFDKDLMAEAIELAAIHKDKLHAMPEAGFEEYRTTEYIRKVCENYPLSFIETGMDTGLVCYLDMGKSSTTALRADIDALPTDFGTEHLCGHDAHAAGLLGALHYLCGIAERSGESRGSAAACLERNVLFIFQPAEEGTRGARAMLGTGFLDRVPVRPDRLFGIHNRPEIEVGYVAVHEGPLMAAKSIFTITLIGRSGHGSTPHKCVDPIVTAAALVSGIQTIISRNTDPFTPAICTVNSINAGSPVSPVPDKAVITGYIRSYDPETHSRMEEGLRRLAESTAEAYECSCDADIVSAVPALVNSREMHEIAIKAAKAALGEDKITDTKPCLASEDFSLLGEEIPSFFYWLGSGSPGRENAPWHDKDFCIAEDYIQSAVALLCASVMV